LGWRILAEFEEDLRRCISTSGEFLYVYCGIQRNDARAHHQRQLASDLKQIQKDQHNKTSKLSEEKSD
jgi:hypothetical protein